MLGRWIALVGLLALMPLRASVLEVRVLLPGGRPAWGADVIMVDCPCSVQHRRTTDAGGWCRFESDHFDLAHDGAVVAWSQAGLAADTTARRLRPPQYYFPGWDQGLVTSPVLIDDGWPAEAPLGDDEPARLTLTLAPWTTATGQLLAESGAPLAGAMVRLARLPVGRGARDTANVPDGLDLATTSDRAGRWRMARWPACDGVLAVSHPQHHVEPLDDLDAWVNRRPRYRLSPPSIVTGRVTDGAGRPVRGAKVVAAHRDEARGTAVTDAAGRYAIRDLGSSTPLPETMELALSSFDGPWVSGEPRYVELVQGGTVSGIDIVARPSALVDLVFADARTQQGVAEVYVRGLPSPAFSRSDGHVRVWIEPGTLDVSYELPWNWFASRPVQEPSLSLKTRPGRRTCATVPLISGRTLRGRVTEAGQAVVKASVTAVVPTKGQAFALTRADGSFQLCGLPPNGTVEVVVRDQDFTERGRWQVSAGQAELRVDLGGAMPQATPDHAAAAAANARTATTR